MSSFDDEFRGFFFGEGCVDIVQSGRSEHHLALRLRIGLNERDFPLLMAVKRRFGGSLYRREATRSWNWTVSGSKRVVPIIHLLLEGDMPSAKRDELRLALRFVDPDADRAALQASLSLMKRAAS